MSIAAVLVLALLLDAALGEPAWLWSRVPHPAVLMGRAIDALDQRLNTGPARRAKGALAVCVLIFGSGLLGWALGFLGPVVECLVAAVLLAQRALVDHVRAVGTALRQSVQSGRAAVALIVSRDCSEMTPPQVARATIESAAENLSDGVVAPAFWFLIGGLPGMIIYKTINTADSMIGYRNDRYERFGWAAARTDDLLNLVPARLTGFMIAVVSAKLGDWQAIVADARRHRSPNAGWPEAAMARALDLGLAGPRSYDGQMRDLAWVNGDARRDIGPDDIGSAISMLWRVWAAMLIPLIAITIALPLI